MAAAAVLDLQSEKLDHRAGVQLEAAIGANRGDRMQRRAGRHGSCRRTGNHVGNAGVARGCRGPGRSQVGFSPWREDSRGLVEKVRLAARRAQEVSADLVSHGIPPLGECHPGCCAGADKRIEHRVTGEAEHPDEPPRNFLGKGRVMSVLSRACHVPVAGEPGLPLLFRERGAQLQLPRRRARGARLLEDQDVLEVDLDDPVGRVRVGAHHHGAAAGVHGGLLAPDDGSQEIEAGLCALADDLCVQGDDPVAAIEAGPGELVPDVHAQPPPLVQDPETFLPYTVQVTQVFMQALPEADLARGPVVLDLPVRRGGDGQLNDAVCQLRHAPAVGIVQHGCALAPSRLHGAVEYNRSPDCRQAERFVP